MKQLFWGPEDYLRQFKQAVDQQIAEGWLLPADAKRMLQWSQAMAEELF
ncbi:alpha/beta hydrolase domain-containing protein [Suicoccus acidiformans]|nr:alpha/beta hydrolase domain-containing protein [Suicoccus acidiformans]